MKVESSEKSKKIITIVLSSIIGVSLLCLSFFGGYLVRWKTEDDEIASIRFILQQYKDNYYFEDGDIVKKFSDAILDEYSEYYTKQEYQEYMSYAEGNRAGIGVKINVKTLTIADVLFNSPAEKSGLYAGGKILSVNGTQVDDYEEYYQVMQTVEIGDAVVMDMDYGGKVKTFSMTKEEFTETFVSYLDSDGYYHFTSDDSGKIGIKKESANVKEEGKELDEETAYVQLKSFSGYINSNKLSDWTTDVNGAAGQFTKVMQVFKENGKTKLILDLRGNPGGYLVIAQSIACHLVWDGENGKNISIGYSSDKKGNVTHYASDKVRYGDYGFKKIVILADENSASASEMLIGAVLDYDAKTQANITNVVLAGYEMQDGYDYRTYGKGIMQTYYTNYVTGEVIKLTNAGLFWPVSGVSIHGVGVTPSTDDRVLASVDSFGIRQDCLKTALELCKVVA